MASSAPPPLRRRRRRHQPLGLKATAQRPMSSRRAPSQFTQSGVRIPPKVRRPVSLRWRATLVWALLMLGIIGLIGRLAQVQLVQAPALQAMAQAQQARPVIPRAKRRAIVDRQGNVLAVDRVVYTVYAHPLLFKTSNADMAQTLSPILGTPVDDLTQRFDQQQTGIKLIEELPEESANRILRLRLDGLELLPTQQRFYPQQEVFAHIVGFTDVDGNPQAGVELSAQDQLLLSGANAPGLRAEAQAVALGATSDALPRSVMVGGTASTMEAAETNSVTSSLTATEPPPTNVSASSSVQANPDQTSAASSGLEEGTPTAGAALDPNWQVQLTLDNRLQRVAQDALSKQLVAYGAQRGTALVMDASNGELLAFAVQPTFDPNRYYEEDLAVLKNWAISDLYEPGSTFKPINIAIALETKAIQPGDYTYDEGRISIGPWSIQNADYNSAGGRGSISVTDVLKYSSNVGMVHLMAQLKPERYYEWLEKLGLGKTTGIDLPAEALGQLKSRQEFVDSRIESATASFGQGLSLTPIQLLQLQGAIANGGTLVTPHIVRGVVDDEGTLRWRPHLPQSKRLFSRETTQSVLEMMEVVVKDGTGKPAQVPGYRIAGKTGTAQKVSHGVYGDGRITSFVAILPVENPRYVVLVVMDEPQGDNAYGSTVSAPVAKTIVESLVVLEGIPPAAQTGQATGQ